VEDAPPNLTVILNSSVAKVLIYGNKVTGVKTIDGRDFYATRDVTLSGRALNSPQLLLLSGVSPAAELKKHGIPAIRNLPEVGKDFKTIASQLQHCFKTMERMIA